MAKPLGLEQLLKMAEEDAARTMNASTAPTLSFTILILHAILDRFKEQDAKMEQVMATHAKLFEDRAKDIAEYGAKCLAAIEKNITDHFSDHEQRIRALECPGKTDNNVR